MVNEQEHPHYRVTNAPLGKKDNINPKPKSPKTYI